jgi:hypothetical protein
MKRQISFIFLCCFGAFLYGQEEPRRIWPEELMKVSAKNSASPKKPAYKVATPHVVVNTVQEDAVVGITIWRMKPASDQGGVTIEAENQKWIPERVEAYTALIKGDRVRLSIEAARKGYLYIINREEYADGSFGEPYLIFPTSRLINGNNQTDRGRVIEVPSQTDNPPYFTLTPGRNDQIAEVLSVLVTSKPIENLQIPDQPTKLSATQVAEWQHSWGKSTGRLELIEGAGKSWTAVEQQAGVGTRLLKHEDPVPQTVFYNPDATAEDPSFINIDLQYGKK